jgi:hypothetical protein
MVISNKFPLRITTNPKKRFQLLLMDRLYQVSFRGGLERFSVSEILRENEGTSTHRGNSQRTKYIHINLDE